MQQLLESFRKFITENQYADEVKSHIDRIVQHITEYGIPKVDIQGIYMYGSAQTGEYGKTLEDEPGDLDVFVLVRDLSDEDDWFQSEHYQELNQLDGLDVALIGSKKELDEYPHSENLLDRSEESIGNYL